METCDFEKFRLYQKCLIPEHGVIIKAFNSGDEIIVRLSDSGSYRKYVDLRPVEAMSELVECIPTKDWSSTIKHIFAPLLNGNPKVFAGIEGNTVYFVKKTSYETRVKFAIEAESPLCYEHRTGTQNEIIAAMKAESVEDAACKMLDRLRCMTADIGMAAVFKKVC